jgi:IrrE N-terminal-like domain
MKKTAENRYPHSATLFKFCKEALEIRYEGNVKVIDQDVGAILGYDPADCSHWKKGKKNIRALSTLRSIADHLAIDERLLIDIASGKVGLEEAVFEYRGYGSFALQGRSLENLKKEFFKNPTRWQNDGTQKPFEEIFDTDRPSIVKAAEAVINAGNFTEAPVYLPEIYKLFNGINLIADDTIERTIKVDTEGTGETSVTTVRYRGPEIRPYVRFLLAKELFAHLARVGHPSFRRFSDSPAELLEIQANIFAGLLLIPGKMLRKEVEVIDSSIDIIQQLAETFWTSKALMNQRLLDYMEHLD